MDLPGQLESILGAECVSQNDSIIVDDCRPGVTVAPATYEAISEVLRFANTENLKVLVLGSGHKLHIGNALAKIDIALSTARLNKVISYEPADLTAVAEAGMRLSDFYATTSRNGQWLPVDPPGEGSTLGGVVAINAFGPLRALYGTPRDFVIGLKVITADGTLVKTGGRVVKNVAGYDLNKLFISSFGTLGVIVETAFKLRPVPEEESTCVITCQSIEPLAKIASQVFTSQLLPMSILLVDSKVLNACGIQAASWALAARFGDNRSAIDYQINQLNRLTLDERKCRPQVLDEKTSTNLWRCIGDFEEGFAPEVTLRINTLPNRTAEFASVCETTLKQSDLSCATIAHAANGVVYHLIQSVGDNNATMAKTIEVIKQLRATLGDSGSVVIERAPVSIKRELDIWGETSGTMALLRGIKQKFDPKSTLNSGRYVGGI